MIKRFHGLDRHKRYTTISVLNRVGEEVQMKNSCRTLQAYIHTLGPLDAVVMEASSGAFWWADRIEARGAQCHILDPYKFKIIKESWTKTDKRDARNMARALWVTLVTGEFGIPSVYKPPEVIRELRKLFSHYALVSRQIVMHKNAIQAVLVENGIVLSAGEKSSLFSPQKSKSALKGLPLSAASRIAVSVSLQMLGALQEAKQRLQEEILLAGEPLKDKVKLLITVRGVSALTALAFLADVGDIQRFRSAKKMNAYLGLVPRMRENGGKSYAGHITRESRKLTRTILTQSIVQVTDASIQFKRYYEELKLRRGAGRARIALIRKLCSVMRRLLLDEQQFRSVDKGLFKRKLNDYERRINNLKEQRRTA
jgi:transposase